MNSLRIMQRMCLTSKLLTNLKNVRWASSYDDHHAPYEVPCAADYEIDDCKILMDLEAELAKHCLRDPWIRNEVWRYNEEHFKNHRYRIKTFLLRGSVSGLIATVVTIILEYLIGGKSDHGHGSHGDDH